MRGAKVPRSGLRTRPAGLPGPPWRLVCALFARGGVWHGDCTVGDMSLPRLPTLNEPAAEWIWRLNPNEFTAADLQAFNAWLRRNPRHRRTAQEFFGLWLALNSLESAGARSGRYAGESGRNVS